MAIEERFFSLGEQWNVIHLPKQPNGFAIFILGDVISYVNARTSSWHQRPDQFDFILELKEMGYTIISSNLHGRHWGSPEACDFFQRMYDDVMKKEILNKKIHIIAEGMGALVAAKVSPKMENVIRSIVLINPCLDLCDHLNKEKSKKFFYKRLVRELKKAYSLEENDVEWKIAGKDMKIYTPSSVPIKILHCIHSSPYTLESHVRPYENLCNKKGKTIEVSIFYGKKAFTQYTKPTIDFIKKHEKIL